jgi:ferredoxin
MSITVTLDLDLCNGYGNCVIAAPDVFDLDPQTNLAVLKVPHPVDEAAVQDAQLDCPVHAISITHSR